MTVHAFGATVDEVQQKLARILPLVDAGAELMQKLHAKLQIELAQYETGYRELEISVETIASDAAQLGGEVGGVQTELETGISALTGGIDDVGQQSNTVLQQLNDARQQVETEIDGASSQLQAGTTAAESNLDTMTENTDSMHTQVTLLKEQAETAFSGVDESVNEFTTKWEQDESKSRESLGSLKSAITETHTPEVKHKFDGFNASTVETVSNVVDLLTEKDGGLSDFFSAFDTDAETLAEDFKARTKQTFGELKECAEDECGKAIEESLENLAKEVVEAFAAEIITSVATTQLGVTTTGMLSPIIPELAIAKKITGVINSIL